VIKEQLDRLFQEQRGTQLPRETYQIRASRTATMGLDDAVVNVTLGPTDSRITRAIGPILVVAKTTPGSPDADSFDGDLNGLLDVAEAQEAWRTSDRSAPPGNFNDNRVSVAEGLDKFTNKIRSRATVNGGSIGLRALVVSGTSSLTSSAGQFVTFNSDTILITPCFPVVNEPGYNIEVYAGPLTSNAPNRTATLLKTPTSIPLASFLNATTGAFLDSIGPFDLVRLTPSKRAGDSTGTVVEATFIVEKCSQWSYFQ